jgi:ABC-type multidrug transport system fused ATPase/permease subunit
MKKNDNQLDLIKELWSFLSPHRKKSFYGLIFLSFISSIAELFVILSAVPFLMFLLNSPLNKDQNLITSIFIDLGINGPGKISGIIPLLFASLIFIAGFIRLMMLRYSLRYSFSLGAEFSSKIYLLGLKANYSLNKKIKSTELMSSANDKVNIAIHNIFLPIINLLSSIITIIIVVLFLLIFKPGVTIFALCVISFLFIFYNFFSDVRLYQNSEVISKKMNESFNLFHQGLATVKDITLSNQFNFFVSKFYAATLDVRSAQYKNAFIKFSPRYIFETFAIIFFILILSNLGSNESKLAFYFPVIGMFCLTIYRLLPYFNQIYFSYSSINGDFFILQDLFRYLRLLKDIKTEKEYLNQKFKFKKTLTLRNVTFKYDNKVILKSVNLTINKGSHIGIIGKSGSGKSTLADIIMSLLVPSSGDLIVDDHVINESNNLRWRANISHVSQNFFLADGSIKDNIILGSKTTKIQRKIFNSALNIAQLGFFSTFQKFNMQVGENGSELSGGERQRVAIARALYKNTDILVLDEATNSLDKKTEQMFIRSLLRFKGKKTIISISHNISSLIYCDQIIKIDKGNIVKIGKFNDFKGPNI